MAAISEIERISNEKEGKESGNGIAVAGAVAILVIMTLFAAWGFFYFKQVQVKTKQLSEKAGLPVAQDQFNFNSVQEAQRALLDQPVSGPSEDLKRLKEEVDTSGQNVQPQPQMYDPAGGTNDFINPQKTQ